MIGLNRYGYLIVFLLLFSARAQDIHFSQFMHNPLYQNPGNTGLFKGDYRFNFAFRDQWRSVTVPYNTTLFSGDYADFYKNLSAGLIFVHDVAGDGRFRTIDFQPTVAVRFDLDEEKKHSLRTGLQFGLNFRELRSDQFFWDSQFGGHVFDPSLPTNENFQRESKANFTLNSGLVYQWFDGQRRNFNVGLGLYNINRQNQGFFGENILRSRRLTLHGRGQFAINDRLDFLPAFVFNAQGTHREFIGGAEFRYIVKDFRGDYVALYLGAFSRIKDAAFLNIGMDYQNWFFGLNYDWNYSKLLPASRIRGGVELTAQYIFKSFKPKQSIHRICPVYL
jgi:type IX secretion system PorP/SprF family membrane protein